MFVLLDMGHHVGLTMQQSFVLGVAEAVADCYAVGKDGQYFQLSLTIF